jgi:RNA polymerase sigma-70 factor (ECF subfamily)
MEDFSLYTDAQLWRAYKEGNPGAYAFMYSKYTPALYSYGWHIIRDQALIEDCLHDLFIHLYDNRQSLGHTDSIKYYLFRALRRRITDSLSRQGKHHEPSGTSAEYNFQVIASPESVLIADQSRRLLHENLCRSINTLPRRQREALYLLYFDELSYQEVADIMCLEVKTVYNQVRNALEGLKKHFASSKLLLLITLLLALLLAY